MANKKISDFTEKSSLANSDLFLVSDGNNTYKATTETMIAKMKDNIGIMVRPHTGTKPAGTNPLVVTADTVAGYTFVCWITASAQGSTSALAIMSPAYASTQVYFPGLTGSSTAYTITALYVRS